MAAKWFLVVLSIGILVTPACTRHQVEVAPVEVKPIHITIDVNVKVDKALDDFFGDIDEESTKQDASSAGQ